MSIIIDLVIVAFILICIAIGYVRGLTGSLIKILSFVLSIIIAFVLFIPTSNFVIKNTKIDDNIEKTIRDTIVSPNGTTQNNMPVVINDYINKRIEETANSAKTTIADTLSKEVSQMIVKVGTWMALFIIAKILLILLQFITSLISKLPVIKQFDKGGGVIYGALEGLIITYVIFAIISFIAPMTSGKLVQNIDKSYIGNQMYNNNLLLNIIF